MKNLFVELLSFLHKSKWTKLNYTLKKATHKSLKSAGLTEF